MTTKNTGKIDPELLSGFLDQELDPKNKEKIQTYLEQNADARKQYQELQNFSQQLRELNSIPVQIPEMEPFWKELNSKINQEKSGLSQPEPAVSSTELLKIIAATRKQPTTTQKIVGGFVPAFTGAALALAVVYFFALATGILDRKPAIINQAQDSKIKQARDPNTSPKNILVKTKKTDPKNIKKVSNPLLDKKLNKTLPRPDLNIEKIINKDDSCVIERMDTEDDVITTVFKVKDKDGSMITVIWIPFKDASPTI